MADNRIIFGFPELGQSATYAVTEGQFSAELPISQLNEAPLKALAEITGTSATFTATLNANYPIRVVALFNHTGTFSGVWRVQVGSYDSGDIPLYTIVSEQYALATDYGSRMLRYFKKNSIHVIPEALANLATGDVVTISITDTDNTNGFIRLGRVGIAPGFTPQFNFNQGSTFGFEARSRRTRTDGGRTYHTAYDAERSMTLDFEGMTEADSRFMYDMIGSLDLFGELIVVPYPNTFDDVRYGFLARLDEMPELAHLPANYQTKIKLIEVIS